MKTLQDAVDKLYEENPAPTLVELSARLIETAETLEMPPIASIYPQKRLLKVEFERGVDGPVWLNIAA